MSISTVNNFKKIRLLMGLNRLEAASLIGISISYLDKIENNIRTPGINTLTKMSSVYKKTIDELLKSQSNDDKSNSA